MIRIESIHIHEFRGIRDLTLEMRGESFVIHGPNGSGKSGVVDAIQFALTGEIRRLRGPGTGELTLGEHGPHVNRRKDPSQATVELTAFIPHLKTKAVIRRCIARPKQPEITPPDDTVRAVFDHLAQHPEITLARREIITLILTEATKRSRDVQTLLQLDRIDQIRAALKTTENRLGEAFAAARAKVVSATDALARHLGVPAVSAETIRLSANERRHALGLPEISELKKDTNVAEGVTVATPEHGGLGQGKESALADLRALTGAIASGHARGTGDAVGAILDVARILESEPDLVGVIKRRALVQSGLTLIDGPSCPLCDAEWDIQKLRSHLTSKLSRIARAEEVERRLLAAAQTVSDAVQWVRSLIDATRNLPEAIGDTSRRLGRWSADLGRIADELRAPEGILGLKALLESGWSTAPPAVAADLRDLTARVEERSPAGTAAEWTIFLAIAQERLAGC